MPEGLCKLGEAAGWSEEVGITCGVARGFQGSRLEWSHQSEVTANLLSETVRAEEVNKFEESFGH